MEGGEFEKKTGDSSSSGTPAHRRGGSKARQSVELSNVGSGEAAPAMAYEPPIGRTHWSMAPLFGTALTLSPLVLFR